MATIINLLIIIIILSHLYFLILEMFLWTKPIGLKIFGQTQSQADASRILAANQGLYNGFLAAGLTVGLLKGEAGYSFIFFFLICISLAGIYGGLTANKRIILFQAVPALLCLTLLLINQG